MTKPKISTVVRAQVTLDIYVGTWGGNSNFVDLHETAQREALQQLTHKLGHGLKVVGKPKIEFVAHTEK
jgi:hypothetical protein